MRSTPVQLSPIAALVVLLLLVGIAAFPTSAPVAAQVTAGGNFGSAVPCLLSESTFATTCAADTIVSPAPASDPALVQFTAGGKGALAPLGARPIGSASNASAVNGIGSVYGLAYDDGAVSGKRRLFAAAFLKRLVSFGPGGPGGIYAYDFGTNTWSLAATVADAWSGSGRSAADTQDVAMIARIGKASLGDMEISPDGRTLYVVNLMTRQIARFDLSGGALTPLPPLSIPFNLISTSAAMFASLRPFALEFYPVVRASNPRLPTLAVGITDTAQRNGANPTAYVLTYYADANTWEITLRQPLTGGAFDRRLDGSTYANLWDEPAWAGAGYGAWNRWYDTLDGPPTRVNGNTATVLAPQPWLTDIEFNHNGTRMFLGLRDRTGDQTFSKNPPVDGAPHNKITIAQGDILAYQLSGGNSTLLTVDRLDPIREQNSAATLPASTLDYFNDSIHAYSANDGAPAHTENHMGALATALRGGSAGFSEQVAATTLLGNSRSGLSFYPDTGGQRSSMLQLIADTDAAGGKATALGDVELLCSYAIIGGRIWQDLNANGVQDGGEPGFPGLVMEVFQGAPTEPALARATTDANGRYVFAVPPNTPVNVRIARNSFATGAPANGWLMTPHNRGSSDVLDSDAHIAYGYIEFSGAGDALNDGVTGVALPMRLRESDERTFDFGLTRLLPNWLIGDRVWNDLDRDGVQDMDEPGVAGVTVTLERDPASSAAPTINTYPLTAITGSGGYYNFFVVEPGLYTVHFNVPTGYVPTRINAGNDDTRDSDVDASTNYRTSLFTLDDTTTGHNRSIDLGLVGDQLDLAVQKTGPSQALMGQVFSYTIGYSLAGTVPADNVQIVDTLPAGVSFVSASPAPSSRSGQTIVWSLGRLSPGAAGQITLNVTAPATISGVSQNVANRATVSTTTSTPADSNPGNNTSIWTTTVVRPAVSVVKAAPASVLVGDELTYSLSYANRGGITASDVRIGDALPASLTFVRFVQNPGGACAYSAGTHLVRCTFPTLAVNASGAASFVVRVESSAGAAIVNTATIQTATTGDDPIDNSSTTTTTVLRPNPSVGITITPSPFSVGSSGAATVTFANPGTGTARGATLTVSFPSGGFTLGALPSGCSFSATTRTITCGLGDLAPSATGARTFPITLPANFPADSLGATATITTATPERPADQANNTATANVPVVRPNVWVRAAGPASIVAQGSVFWYVVDYGNTHFRSPALTRAAQNVVLRATLPPDVTYLSADTAPTSTSGQVLTWDLGTLGARDAGQIIIVVQTNVPAGAVLNFEAVISTTTPGDDPSDNRATVRTDVVQPPAEIPQAGGDLRLAIHSDLDPNSQDGDPTNGVYLSEGTQIAWPAGEVLDFTPRLSALDMGDPLPWPYEYRARVIGWSIVGFAVNGASRNPQAADDRGRSGCRPGALPAFAPRLLAGCRYAYLGGEDLASIASPIPLREEQLAQQAHVYWTQPPAPAMRDDVYLYTLDPLEGVGITIQLEIEIQIVNAYPGAPVNDPSIPPIPIIPLPDPERQLIETTFDVALLVPRSVVGPGSAGR